MRAPDWTSAVAPMAVAPMAVAPKAVAAVPNRNSRRGMDILELLGIVVLNIGRLCGKLGYW